MEFQNAHEKIRVPGFTDLERIGPTTVNPILAILPSLEGVRVGNGWVEFSLTKEHPDELHEARMKREPTMAELGMDYPLECSELSHLKPSELALHLSPDDALQIPLRYIRKLYELRVINDPTPVLTFPADDNAARVSNYANKIIFGDTTYRVIPQSIAGSFANGAISPRFNVYGEAHSLAEINNAYTGNGVERLLAFYGSPMPSDSPEEILRTFPMIAS